MSQRNTTNTGSSGGNFAGMNNNNNSSNNPNAINNDRTSRNDRMGRDMQVADEKIAKLTSTIFNPKNLKMYQIVFIVLFILFIWLVEFSNAPLIIKSLFIVSLIALWVIESVIIFSYV